MSDTVITRQLTRVFDGREVVKDVNLRVEQGIIYGLVGRNGAGKPRCSSCFSACCDHPQGGRRCWVSTA